METEGLYPVRKIRDLKDMMTQSCMIFKDKTAFLIKENDNQYREISYSQFGKDADALGTALLKLGLENSLIAVIGENRYEWCVSYMAAVNGVGTVVPLDKDLSSDELQKLLNICEAKAIIFSGRNENQIKEIMKNVPKVKYFIGMDLAEDAKSCLSFNRLIYNGKDLIKAGDEGFIKAKIDSGIMNILMFLPDSSDSPKGVMLTHHNVCSNISSVCSTVYVSNEDVSLSILPIHNAFECTVDFLCMIYNGGTIAFNNSFKNLPKNIKEVKPTLLVTVPSLLDKIYRKIWEKAEKKMFLKVKLKLSLFLTNLLNSVMAIDIRNKVFRELHDGLGGRVRLIITGAGAIRPEVSKCFRQMGIQVLQGYGLTECSPLITGNREMDFVDGSCGLPIPGVEVKISKPGFRGVGEILVKGENVMLGYFGNKEATEKSIRNGWFYTEDLGRLDKNGFLYVTGHLKQNTAET
ncbi:MAG: AMP-binding protein [Clostridia bacterium]